MDGQGTGIRLLGSHARILGDDTDLLATAELMARLASNMARARDQLFPRDTLEKAAFARLTETRAQGSRASSWWGRKACLPVSARPPGLAPAADHWQ